MKLNRQLVLLFLAALLPLVVLSAVLGAAALRQGQRDMVSDAQDRVAVLAAGVSRELNAQVEVVQTVTQSPLLDGTVDQARFDQIAARLLSGRPHWRALTLSDPQGERITDYPRLNSTRPRKVIDKSSQAEAVRTGLPVIGQILTPPRLRPAFVIFAPVIRDGRVVYVLDAVMEPDAIRNLLLSSQLPTGWRAGIIDRSFRVVTRTSRPDVAGTAAAPEGRAAMARSPTGFYRAMGTDGTPLVVAYRILPGSGWSVHVAMPQANYEAPFRRALALVGVGAATSLMIVVLFMLLLLRELRLRQQEAATLEESRRLEGLGRITGGVAHDFNNLLMIMQGSAELLKRRVGDERASALVDAILAAGQRGQTLTRQLLAFGRRSSHQPVSFLLQERIEELRALLRQAVQNDINIGLNIPTDVWPVHADPSALEMALINLAVNARDAMPNGGRLTVSAVNVTLGKGRDDGTGLTGEFVAVAIADTGVGIPADQLSQVFEPFFTTKPPGKGTGLGLSQVYGFTRQSGGAVTIRSRCGEGVTVTLYLPRGEPITVRLDPERAVETQNERGHVMLVEDNPEVAEVTQAMLTGIGYSVSWSRDAASALAALEAGGAADMLMSDIALDDGMSGLDLGRAVRERWPDLPIVLMTGYSEALSSGGAHGFLVLAKPFGVADMASVIRRARDAKARTTPSETESQPG